MGSTAELQKQAKAKAKEMSSVVGGYELIVRRLRIGIREFLENLDLYDDERSKKLKTGGEVYRVSLTLKFCV